MDGMSPEGLARFHPAVRDWFAASFPSPTRAQRDGWPAIARGESTLILAPTGSGKTLAAFLWCINRLMFEARPGTAERCRVLYVSPLKALAVDVERNLRAPIAGIASMAGFRGLHYEMPAVAVRTGDTPPRERARFRREPSDILITTPESLYLLLTANARETLRSIDTVIVDEIHALVPTKRGAHLALSLERLEALVRHRCNASVCRRRNALSTKSRGSSAAWRRRTARRGRGARETRGSEPARPLSNPKGKHGLPEGTGGLRPPSLPNPSTPMRSPRGHAPTNPRPRPPRRSRRSATRFTTSLLRPTTPLSIGR